MLLPSSTTSCASVLNIIYGWSIVNKAHDFERKLMPWKQAKDRLPPLRLMVPPTVDLCDGKVKLNIDSLQPDTCSSTNCQCRWCRISDIQDAATVQEIFHNTHYKKLINSLFLIWLYNILIIFHLFGEYLTLYIRNERTNVTIFRGNEDGITHAISINISWEISAVY